MNNVNKTVITDYSDEKLENIKIHSLFKIVFKNVSINSLTPLLTYKYRNIELKRTLKSYELTSGQMQIQCLNHKCGSPRI